MMLHTFVGSTFDLYIRRSGIEIIQLWVVSSLGGIMLTQCIAVKWGNLGRSLITCIWDNNYWPSYFVGGATTTYYDHFFIYVSG